MDLLAAYLEFFLNANRIGGGGMRRGPFKSSVANTVTLRKIYHNSFLQVTVFRGALFTQIENFQQPQL